jgi:hypothetical protein
MLTPINRDAPQKRSIHRNDRLASTNSRSLDVVANISNQQRVSGLHIANQDFKGYLNKLG